MLNQKYVKFDPNNGDRGITIIEDTGTVSRDDCPKKVSIFIACPSARGADVSEISLPYDDPVLEMLAQSISEYLQIKQDEQR